MRDFKVKLVSFPAICLHIIYIMYLKYLPYGLGVLTAFLRNHDYNVSLDDLSIKIENYNRRSRFSLNPRINIDVLRYGKEIIDYVLGRCRNRKIEHFAEQIAQIADCQGDDLIGISVMTYFHFLLALLLVKKIKSLSNARIVLGGPFITIYGKELFEQFPLLDYMVVGDGQMPLLKLIEHLEGRIPIEDVPSLFYRQDGSTRVNPRKFFPIEDVYLPDFSDPPLDFYRLMIDNNRLNLPYHVTRGCIHKCSFCKWRAINPSIEFKSYNKVVTELEAMKRRYQHNSFWFCDETINCSYEYLDKLCDIFIEKDLDISWRATARADNLDRKILHKMKRAGCRLLSFGIESGSNRILKKMGKGFTSEQASRVLKDSYQEGIKNIVNFIVSFPHEKEEDIFETIDFIRKNSEYIDFILSAIPLWIGYGTPLYNNPEKFGIENLRPLYGTSAISKCKCFAFDEIGGLKWEEKVRQQKYFRKKVLRANFKYIISKKHGLVSIIFFWFYFWLGERLNKLFIIRLSPLYERLFPYLFRKKCKIN